MSFTYTERPSASRLVDVVWKTVDTSDGVYTAAADACWDMIFTITSDGQKTALLSGPSSATTPVLFPGRPDTPHIIPCYATTMTATDVQIALQAIADPLKAEHSGRFFKTAPGQYGAGDLFLGISVPAQRQVAKQCTDLPLDQAIVLLRSPFHECRLTALFILVIQYKKGDAPRRQAIYEAYLANTRYINNWDLVDSSAEHIVGPQQPPGGSRLLERLAHSNDLWERRIAMLACYGSIKQGHPEPAFTIIEILRDDRHDLIQKAVGWMLREIGKRCGRELLLDWLLRDSQYQTLPRTTLRYAIEHFPPHERQAFLTGSL